LLEPYAQVKFGRATVDFEHQGDICSDPGARLPFQFGVGNGFKVSRRVALGVEVDWGLTGSATYTCSAIDAPNAALPMDWARMLHLRGGVTVSLP
jgi:hypothetical protein